MNRETLRKVIARCKRDDNYLREVISEISLDADRNDTYRFFNSISTSYSLKKKMNNSFLPQSLKYIGHAKIVYNEKLPQKDILDWATYLIGLFGTKVNQYLEYKKEYERLLFSRQYEDAYLVLLKIENSICVSMWSCGQRLLIEEVTRGLEANKKLLEKFLIETKGNPIANTLLEFYSYSSEKNMSYLNYQGKVKKFIEHFSENEMIGKYFDFKLNLDKKYQFDYNSILQIDSQLSIIDMYNSFIEILQIESAGDNYYEIKNAIINSIKVVSDYRLANILVKYSDLNSKLLANYIYADKDIYEIMESYTIGNYSHAICKMEVYLENNKDDFQMILFLIKAHINAFRKIDTKHPIYSDIYNIFTMDKCMNESITNLYLYLKLYSGTSWKHKIRGFISRKLSLETREMDYHLSHINDLFLTPNFVSNIPNKKEKEKFLNLLSEYCPKTTALYYYMNSDTSDSQLDITLDSIRRNLYISTREMERKNYSSCIQLLLLTLSKLKDDDYYNLERVYRKLLLAYKESNLLMKCIELTVDAYFTNRNLIKRFSLDGIFENVKNCDDATIKRSIKYPIFVYIFDKNDYKSQRIAYSNYMDYNNLKTLQDIMSINKREDLQLLVFFLHKICVQHLIKRDIRLAANGLLADEIRINILWELIKLDSINRKVYYEEINAITMKRSVRDRIKQINQSRIFVDIENIKIENKDILIENFNKYIMIKQFEDKVTSIDINSLEYMDVLKNIVSEMNSRIASDVNYSQEVIVLKDLITRITEEFLYNEKYGLNTFLSSRIRHGYCNNQLTTLFYDYHLMSKTINSESTIYSINEYWDSLSNEDNDSYISFKQYLSDFTYAIDKKVGEIKNDWIRVKFNPKDIGLFDYSSFINQCLIINKDSIVDFDVFFEHVVNLLWNQTDIILEHLRFKIESELKEYFIEELNKLEINMKQLEGTGSFGLIQEVVKKINLCKVKVESVIKEFSDVFHKRDISYCDYTMQDLVSTCLEISQKLNSNFKNINLKQEIKAPYYFSGDSFSYFVDIVNIIINNSLERSGIDDYSKLDLSITITDEYSEELVEILQEGLKEKGIDVDCSNFMTISIKNNLSMDADIDEIKRKINSIFDNRENYEVLRKFAQTEGGSGLYKLYKTMQYNIGAPYSIFFNIDEDCFEIILFMGVDSLILKEDV
jgi:hypothetical protein